MFHRMTSLARLRVPAICVLAVAWMLGSSGAAGAATSADLKAVQASIDGATDWLMNQRDATGAWRSEYGPGFTGLALTAILRDPKGRRSANDPDIRKALNYLVRLQTPDGSIYDPDSQLPLPNYNTSVSLMALSSAKSRTYDAAIKKAQDYLMKSQWDQGEGASPEDSNYGGIGYGSNPSVRDMSNLNFALQALKESGVPNDAAVWDKAGEDEQGRPRSYANMTYAGLLSFIYANVAKDDPRVEAAYDWLRNHWSTDENYPMGQEGLYYGYHTMAKALRIYGVSTLATPDGAVDWYDELADAILAKQTPDGFWPPNDADRWFEGDPVLVTAYSVLALEAGYPSR